MENKKATIKTVAKEAGCSTTAVCFAFSGSDKISEETRQRILEIAARQGYVPNKAAQSLSRNSKHIALILPASYDEVMSQFRKGILDALASYMWCKLDYDLFNYEWYDAASAERAMEQALAMPCCDGMLVSMNYRYTDSLRPAFDRINASGIPVVCLSDANPVLNCVSMVSVDAVTVGKAAAGLLYRAGCRRVAALIGDMQTRLHIENMEGFERRAQELGVSVCDIIPTYNDVEKTYQYAQDLLTVQQPDGIFVSTYAAEAVCRAVRDMGMTGKVAVVGVDLCNKVSDVLESGELLASFYQNQTEQGRLATNVLIDTIFSGGMKTYEPVICAKPELVTRELLKFYRS